MSSVQLPCGETTVKEVDPPPVLHPTPTACPFATCGFVTPTVCHQFATPCHFGTPITVTCWHFHSPICHTFHSPVTCLNFASPPVTCPFGTIPHCPGGSPIDPTGPIEVDPEVLPQLREQLQAQLDEIDKAQQALKDREDA